MVAKIFERGNLRPSVETYPFAPPAQYQDQTEVTLSLTATHDRLEQSGVANQPVALASSNEVAYVAGQADPESLT